MSRFNSGVVTVLFAATLGGAIAAQQPGSVAQPTRDQSNQKSAPAPPSGTITGRVIAADTGRPVKRARVFATAAELPEGRGALTNDDGTFALAELPAGRYSLTASKAGFIMLSYGQRRPLQAGTPLQLGEAEQLKGLEFRLPRGGVITGHIFDENGDAMPGAMVRVMRYQYAQGERRLVPVGNAQTDDRGEYRVWGLNPGEYYVSVLVRNFGGIGRMMRGAFGGPVGGAPQGLAGNITAFFDSGDEQDQLSYAPTYYPGTTTANDARPVSVGLSQEVLGVDFGIQLVRSSKVAGRVVNPDGTPSSSGNVMLMPDGSGPARGQIGATYNARIDWDGAFAIQNVPPGRYTLRARGNDSDTPLYAAVPLTVAGGDVANLNIVLMQTATLAGTVVFQGQQGTPGDPAAVRVSTTPADQAPFGPTPNARVEKNGQFTLDGIPAGAQFVRAPNAPRGWMLKSIAIDGRDVTDQPVEFRPGQKVGGAVITFTSQVTQVTGTLTDGSGNPVTEYTVLVFPTDTSLWRPLSRHIMTARPDQTGKYQLRGLPPGEYYLVAIDPSEAGEWFEPAFLDQHRPGATRFALAEGDAKVQDLKVDGRTQD